MIRTRVGNIFISLNKIGTKMEDGESELVTIVSPEMAAVSYVGKLSVSQTSKLTTIAALTLTDEVPERAIAYLKQLAICYNRQANEDKNEIAVRTEQFINGRLEKINAELGSTEGALEKYKRANKVVELKVNAGAALNRSNEYERQLADANMQVALLNSIADYMNEPANKYQTLPSNVGLNDATATTLINRYNDIVLNRNRLLRTASENSPTVTPLTAQLDDLASSIRRAMAQARRNMAIQRQSAESQYGKYQNEIVETPGQERILTQIGRQQEVKSALYTMLLQKREENSISLAATADKGKLIDEPAFGGRVSPKKTIICLAALVLGGAIPFFFFVLLDFFRYKIEGHEDVAKLTKLPILADVPVAAESAKTKADIVVHENQNNHMEEVFRSMRTSIQFMLKEGQKVILTTSTTSGEGKTFIAANLAVSFALLGKKVVLVGLDIRKPRLAELFEINNHHTGITNLLTKAKPTVEDVKSQMLDSGVNPNLDLLLAGPIPPNPAELMARDSLDQVFDMLREMYDYIIIDTAPLGLVTDTLQLKRLTDCSVYICRTDYTPKESFTMINGLAEEDKLPNLSIVINGVDLSKKKYGYYYGYGTYGKYGKYGKYGSYGGYGHYGKYGKYGSYGSYGNYGHYGRYGENKYNNANDSSIKR
jgi:capsular exopolysaccharide synthesis family protein